MRIAAADLALASDHRFAAVRQVSERLAAWDAPPAAAADRFERPRGVGSGAYARADLTANATASGATPGQDCGVACAPGHRERIVIDLLQRVFGMQDIVGFELELSSAQASAVQQSAQLAAQGGQGPAGWGVAYDYHAEYHEIEQLRFAAEGTITTADGQRFAISFSYEMRREYHETRSVSYRAGDAARVDPLTLDLGGGIGFDAASAAMPPWRFDLDTDGVLDQLPRLRGGAAFLGLDRDGDGRIGDGRELFGPRTGDGFAELAALDGDGNGWIDAGDLAWEALLLLDGDGGLLRLSDARIGALATGNVAAAFTHTGAGNRVLAELRAVGLYLREDGVAGALQQVDLVG